MIYVQKQGSDTWHWAANCSVMPHRIARRVVVERGRPRGDLCNQCRAKERRGTLVPIAELSDGT
jgi:hypothetical protein